MTNRLPPLAAPLLLSTLLATAGPDAVVHAQSTAPHADPATLAAATIDTLVDVGGHRLHVRARPGTAPVTVLFEAGGGADLSSWATVPDRVAAATAASVVVYDRAGLGGSELGPDTLSPDGEVADIRVALERLGLPGRTVVVAHSYGALLALLHAHAVPDRVAALVLVDPMNPRFATEQGAFLASTVPDIDEPASDGERALVRMVASFDDLVARLLPLEPTIAVPMTVVSAGIDWWGPEDVEAAWSRSHGAMADARPNRTRVLATASRHDIPATDPALLTAAILEAVEAARR